MGSRVQPHSRRYTSLSSPSGVLGISSGPGEVLGRYDIGNIERVEQAGGTAGKCWRVTASSGRYFLRCRGPRTSSQQAVEWDHALRRHLIAHGVPTAAPIETRSGETWVQVEGRAFELYPFVEGRRYRGGPIELAETGRALARFHLAAAGFAGRGRYSSVRQQFAMAAPEVGGTERIDDPALIAAAFERMASGEAAMEYALEQSRSLVEHYGASSYEALPRWLIHGDYHPGNLLYGDSGAVAGIFDLDWACEHTRARDLADAVYFFATARTIEDADIESLTTAAEPDLEQALAILRAYREIAPPEPDEVRAIPMALAARWLAMRLEGSAKVPPERRTWFITRGLELPLRWLHTYGEQLVRALL